MSQTAKKITFLALFIIVGFISLQIPFTKLAGSNVSFTLFDFFGPIAGAFLGPVLGVFSVLIVELVNVVVKQTPLTTPAIIRLFPMLFAVYYFGVFSKKKTQQPYILAVPVVAILLFIIHPIGRTVWYFALFWTIPILAYFKRDTLLVRSLGSTFTAHAVGGAAWIWALNLPAVVWKGLIPVVIMERTLMTLGIAGSYLLMKFAIFYLIRKKILPSLDAINPSHAL